jgi:hypothetical protein
MGAQQKVNGAPVLVDGLVEFALDTDASLVHSPALIDGACCLN